MLPVDVVDAVVHVDALLDREEHQLMGDRVFKNDSKGQHWSAPY